MSAFVMVCAIVVTVALTVSLIKDIKEKKKKAKQVTSNEETRQD